MRALESVDELSDLTNGMKPGQSEAFDPAEQSAQIKMFRRMAFGSQEYSTEFFNQTQSSWRSRDNGYRKSPSSANSSAVWSNWDASTTYPGKLRSHYTFNLYSEGATFLHLGMRSDAHYYFGTRSCCSFHVNLMQIIFFYFIFSANMILPVRVPDFVFFII